ncbi:MAG: ABC transporter permease [Planctomycetota bacterium]|nr:ABC transporter permease [Planctomycetota bacterium]MDA1164348.1 ABC transporter permease [Planctomycetota bacterium]
MLKFAPYLLKTLWRHRARTMLTVSGSAVALFVFCFVGSVQHGLDSLTSQSESTLIVFQANKFCPATSHLPQDYDQIISKIDGVRDIVPIQVFTNNCRASLDVVVFYGVPAAKVRTIRDFTLVEGSWSEFENSQDAGIVGETVARRRNLKLGTKFSVGDVKVTVAGIFKSSNKSEEDYVYTHLDFLQRTPGMDLVGTVTQHEVILDSSVDPNAIARKIDDRFRGGPVETDTRTKGVFQASSLADLVELIELSHYLGYACVGLMTMLISTTTFMAVQDRIKEHAVLQTLGFSGYLVFGLVLAESVLISVGGGVVGTGLAMLTLAGSGLSVGAEAVTIAFTPSVKLAMASLTGSLAVGIAAGLFPSIAAAQSNIVDGLRQA